MFNTLKSAPRHLWRALLPAAGCLLCGGRSTESFCPACLRDLLRPVHGCRRCARVLPEQMDLCGNCLVDPPPFSKTRTLLPYAYPADRLVLLGKFQQRPALLRELGRLMARHVVDPQCLPDALIPVPMHPFDLFLRGYNQAVELARPIARRHSIPLALNAAYCSRRKHRQSTLSIQERKRNVKGVFAAHPLPAAWKNVALLDDVMTSGATSAELARVLLEAGAENVEVWCCARR